MGEDVSDGGDIQMIVYEGARGQWRCKGDVQGHLVRDVQAGPQVARGVEEPGEKDVPGRQRCAHAKYIGGDEKGSDARD